MGQLQQFLPFLLMFVVLYFFMIRPQQKRAKNEKEFESGLKVGDKIITKAVFTVRFQNLLILL
jgi:preprotein translocase subunit YajC